MTSATVNDDALKHLINLIEDQGHDNYLGEAVTLEQHFLQAAALAQEAGYDDETIVAALFHDIGHLRDQATLSVDSDVKDLHHGHIGAQMLSAHFPAAVVEPVRLHIDAKRYLCATEEQYFAGLSDASVYSLQRQGGPMNQADCKVFENNSWHQAAIKVRRLDDLAKDPNKPPIALSRFMPILQRVVERHHTDRQTSA